MRSIFILSVTSLSLVSCGYYSYRFEASPAPKRVEAVSGPPRYVIVHHAESTYALGNVIVDSETHKIRGVLSELPMEHQAYKNPKASEKKINRYKSSGPGKTPEVTREVHLYLNTTSVGSESLGQVVQFDLSDIEKIAVYKQNAGVTVLATTGILALIVLTLLIFTKSINPYSPI